jgi:hypothetical protein
MHTVYRVEKDKIGPYCHSEGLYTLFESNKVHINDTHPTITRDYDNPYELLDRKYLSAFNSLPKLIQWFDTDILNILIYGLNFRIYAIKVTDYLDSRSGKQCLIDKIDITDGIDITCVIKALIDSHNINNYLNSFK